MPQMIVPEGKIVLAKYIQETSSGLEAATDEKDSRIGRVYQFGPARKKDPQIKLHKNDIIIYKKYVSNDLYLAIFDAKYDFIEYDDILAVISEDK